MLWSWLRLQGCLRPFLVLGILLRSLFVGEFVSCNFSRRALLLSWKCSFHVKKATLWGGGQFSFQKGCFFFSIWPFFIQRGFFCNVFSHGAGHSLGRGQVFHTKKAAFSYLWGWFLYRRGFFPFEFVCVYIERGPFPGERASLHAKRSAFPYPEGYFSHKDCFHIVWKMFSCSTR